MHSTEHDTSVLPVGLCAAGELHCPLLVTTFEGKNK